MRTLVHIDGMLCWSGTSASFLCLYFPLLGLTINCPSAVVLRSKNRQRQITLVVNLPELLPSPTPGRSQSQKLALFVCKHLVFARTLSRVLPIGISCLYTAMLSPTAMTLDAIQMEPDRSPGYLYPGSEESSHIALSSLLPFLQCCASPAGFKSASFHFKY